MKSRYSRRLVLQIDRVKRYLEYTIEGAERMGAEDFEVVLEDLEEARAALNRASQKLES